jgi:CRISPR-associated protein Cas1
VCAQVLLLREHGYQCEHGEIYYAKDRARVPISITPMLISETLWAVERIRELARGRELPPPLVDSPKCDGCSLVGICLPDETHALRARQADAGHAHGLNILAPIEAGSEVVADEFQGLEEADPWGFGPVTAKEEDGRSSAHPVRRLFPARDDKLPVYVQEQGAFVRLEGERLIVQRREHPAVEARLTNTSHVALYGSAHITTPAIRTLMDRGIPLLFFSSGGWFCGYTAGHDSKNVELRLAQYAATQDRERCLKLARGFVASKILNCRTLLRRNHAEASRVALFELKQLARKARDASTLESLLGIEGTAARTYFSEFSGMLKVGEGELEAFDLAGRNRRPPRDPINALLSFTYSLLSKELVLALRVVGLDSMLGFYHQPHFGRPSLALDLMEEFRPVIADSVVITAVNNRVVTSTDFVRAAGSVSLTAAGRKRLIQAFERRMDQLVIHPIFDYRISYRRVLEVQARLLSRHLLGEIPRYPEFRVR